MTSQQNMKVKYPFDEAYTAWLLQAFLNTYTNRRQTANYYYVLAFATRVFNFLLVLVQNINTLDTRSRPPPPDCFNLVIHTLAWDTSPPPKKVNLKKIYITYISPHNLNNFFQLRSPCLLQYCPKKISKENNTNSTWEYILPQLSFLHVMLSPSMHGKSPLCKHDVG